MKKKIVCIILVLALAVSCIVIFVGFKSQALPVNYKKISHYGAIQKGGNSITIEPQPQIATANNFGIKRNTKPKKGVPYLPKFPLPTPKKPSLYS